MVGEKRLGPRDALSIALVDLQLLQHAIMANDPPRELALRTRDLIKIVQRGLLPPPSRRA